MPDEIYHCIKPLGQLGSTGLASAPKNKSAYVSSRHYRFYSR